MLRYHGGESSIPYVISAPRNGLFDSSLFWVSEFGWNGNNPYYLYLCIFVT